MKHSFHKQKPTNLFTGALEALGVRYTHSYSDRFFREHPHSQDLYGLSKMLSDYGIENEAIRLKDKEQALADLPVPFIAHTGMDFLTVTAANQKEVSYVWKEKEITVTPQKFSGFWSGVALLMEKNERSVEPDYRKHLRSERLERLKHGFIALFVCFAAGYAFVQHSLYTNIGLSTALLINCIGLYICYLLVLKQLHVQSRVGDKLCSLFLHQNDCNNVLESDAAKIAGFSWSEIGFGYFTTNLLLLLFVPACFPYLVWANLCTLPYTVWSISYQKFVVKQWCPLCLLTQGVLWLLFLNNLFFGFITLPKIQLLPLLLAAGCYVATVLFLNILIPKLSAKEQLQTANGAMNRLKGMDNVFVSLLKTKSPYAVDDSVSSLIWGNPAATNRITVITNPHCNPCARMHGRLKQLLKDTGNGYCIQYILSSFNEELEESNRQFIAMYQEKERDTFLQLLKEWYEKGRNNREAYYAQHAVDRKAKEVQEELVHHKQWLEQTGIRATPTVLFNGYPLPDVYRVEDLRYFAELEMK